MTKSLIIVESAKKAKTIKGMLGPGYTVRATGGHVLEMPRDDIHVDLQTFEPTLYLIRGKGKQLKQLQTAAAKADAIYLATDPDREGEAIARHVVSRLGSSATRKAKRIAFTAITQRDVRAALANPRNIDQNLVEAQTARRVIDRLVGYMVSPVLWAGLSGAKGLSAGRVQSPALWLVVERERVIRAFKPEEWWSVDAELSRQETPSGQRFWAGLIKIQGKKPALKNAQAAETVKKALENADWRVLSVKKGQRLRRPYPPSDHLPAQRLFGRIAGSAAGGARSGDALLGQRLSAPQAAPLRHPRQNRSGSPRSHSPHRPLAHAQKSRTVPFAAAVSPVPSDLATLYCQPNETRSLRHADGGR
ncbi:MAG: hypothetical protein B6243_10795 [Anaerolineaceae bacterium 4572_5.2]|nr:MAG: hypothetical protein B6243_10795 [Anaerolineaceae bacterium 4572_5.2]